MTRILVVAQVRLYRDGLARTIQGHAGLTVVATAANESEAARLAVKYRPEVVLLDVSLPEVELLVKTLLERIPRTKIVGLGVAECDEEVLACVEAGVSAYVPRDGSIQELIAVIETVLKGGMLCSPRIAAALAQRLKNLHCLGSSVGCDSLTLRERQVAELLDQGQSNKEIGQVLHIEVATVKNHIHRILEKLHVRSRGEAAARLRRSMPPWRSDERSPAREANP